MRSKPTLSASAGRSVRAGMIGFALIVTLFPILWTFLLSLKSQAAATSVPPKVTFAPTLSNYTSGFRAMWPYALHSLITCGSVTLLSMTAGTLGGYAFAKFPIRGKEKLLTAVLTTLVIPPIIIAIPLYYLAVHTRIEGSLIAIILAQAMFNTPFVVWMMRSFFADAPVEIDEAAMLDGASAFKTFQLVGLPLAVPGLVVTATLSAFYSWSEFLFALILSGPNSQTIPVYIAGFQTDTVQVQWALLGSTIVLAMVPIIVFTISIQRHLVRGLAFGAVKG